MAYLCSKRIHKVIGQENSQQEMNHCEYNGSGNLLSFTRLQLVTLRTIRWLDEKWPTH